MTSTTAGTEEVVEGEHVEEVEPEEAEHQPQPEVAAATVEPAAAAAEEEEEAGEEEEEAATTTQERKLTKKQRKKQKKREARTAALNLAKELREAAAAAAAVPGEEGALAIPGSLSQWLVRLDATRVLVRRGLSRDMRVEGLCFVNDALLPQMLEEFHQSGGFLPALRQIANVASLPGIVKYSYGMPDAHSGYGFAIGGVAAMDMGDPHAVVSPGGVGFDINCGVCLLRTNLDEADVHPLRDALAKELFARIPVGVGSHGGFQIDSAELDSVLRGGLRWLAERGAAWPSDLEHCEEGGCIQHADPAKVSRRAKARGLPQCGTLGSGNHYVEVQAVDEIYDAAAAEAMGLNKIGRICVMIHSGSRGLGHQVCTDALAEMQRIGVDNPNDRQLTGVPITSQAGRDYIAAMSAAANYAFANRGVMRMHARDAFAHVFRKRAADLDMHLVYDVCHNIAKIEDHVVDGRPMRVLVHRKGATRAFPPGHPLVPEAYRSCGQPVIIGGSMGTCSYVLTGTETGMQTTFGSTCHGAGRSLSRAAALREMTAKEVMDSLRAKGVLLKIATPKLVAEEAAEAYKDVSQVVKTCHDAGISKLCVRLRPLIVCKG